MDRGVVGAEAVRLEITISYPCGVARLSLMRASSSNPLVTRTLSISFDGRTHPVS
jgi:hypothetical protein